MNEPNGYVYENAAFATATICAPGSTSNCVTIPNLLVDTGSTGLRVFASEVSSLNLPAVNASNGSAAYDCISFVDGAYLWGPVQQADVTLGGETASKVPIHVISGSTSGVPSSCSNGSTENDNTAILLGANGILGVGVSRPIASMPAQRLRSFVRAQQPALSRLLHVQRQQLQSCVRGQNESGCKSRSVFCVG